MTHGDPVVRYGAKIIHTAPPGANVTFLAGQRAIAIVAHPGGPPYFVYPDGQTEVIKSDPAPRGLISDYDPLG